jgi:hypothetical protein
MSNYTKFAVRLLDGIAPAKDQAIKSQSRKRPSSSRCFVSGGLREFVAKEVERKREFAAKEEIERKYSAHRAIEEKLAGLGVLASSEEVEAFVKEFTALQGAAALDALIKPLREARKRHLVQQKPVAEPKKAARPSKCETKGAERVRIWQAWRKHLSSIGQRKRATPKECMDLVRVERPQADSALVKKIMGEVYEYNRSKQ